MDYYSLSRKELQVLCKKYGIRANTTNAAMADALQSLNIAPDSETEIRIGDAMVLGNAGLNSPASVTTSCRRTPLRTSTRSMLRTSRSKRESEEAEEEEPKSPTAGGIDNLEEASRSMAPSARRITTRSSARKQVEKGELAEELITPAKAVGTLVPNSRRKPTRVSARKQTLKEGTVQQEAEGKKEVLEKLRTPSFSSMICTRRSSRLRGKNQDSEANHLEQKLEKKFIDEKGMQQSDATAGSDQEIFEELPGEPAITIQQIHVPVSEECETEPSGKTMREVLSINETTSLLKQSDQNDGAVGESPLCSDEEAHDIPATTETSLASSKLSDLFPQPEAPAGAADKVITVDISASSSSDSDLRFINGEECNAPFPSLMDAHAELLPSEADQVAVTSHEASIGAVMLSAEVSDGAGLLDQITGILANLELEDNDGFAQEASLNPVELENNISESLSSGKDSDNIPATDEVLRFSGAAVTSHEASADAVVLSVKVSDEAQVVGQTTEVVAKLEQENRPLHSESENDVGEILISCVNCGNISTTNKEVLQFPGTASVKAQEDGFIAQGSLNPMLPSEPENNVGEVLFSGISSDDVPATNEEAFLSAGIAPVEAQEVPSACDGFIAQEASLNAVHLLPSEPENNVGEVLFSGINCDNVPATDLEVLQVSGIASVERQEVPYASVHHEISAASILDEFSGDLQQIEEVNEKSPSLGSWCTSPLSASLLVASPGPELFMGVAPKDAQEVHSENTCHESLAIDLIATTTVPEEVLGSFQQIEGANEKSPSFGSWSAKSPCSEFLMTRKSGKSRSSIGSSRGKTSARIRMFTTVEEDKENKSMNEENMVVDKENEKSAGLVEFDNYSLRKLRFLVKEGIKNKVQMNERTPLEILSANCLLGNENHEVA